MGLAGHCLPTKVLKTKIRNFLIWLTIRTNGVGILDVRQTILTDDGALVYIYYKGISDLGPDGYKNFLEGAPPPPEGIILRTNPWFQTVHPNYLWMTRGLFVEVGKAYLDRGEVCYDIYHVKYDPMPRTPFETLNLGLIKPKLSDFIWKSCFKTHPGNSVNESGNSR